MEKGVEGKRGLVSVLVDGAKGRRSEGNVSAFVMHLKQQHFRELG